MASMTESQFRTFRADVRNEVRLISNQIRQDVYNAVVSEARVVAGQTARKHTEQMARNGELGIPADLTNRLQRVEREIAKLILGRAHSDDNSIEARVPPFVTNKLTPKNFTVIRIDGERFTFFRGEWRRDSQMEEFARQARRKASEASEEYRKFNRKGFF